MITITCNSIKDSIAQRQKYISFKNVLVEVRRQFTTHNPTILNAPVVTHFPKNLPLHDLLNL